MSDEMLLSAVAWTFVQVIRATPSIIWSIRCRAGSRTYTCPPLFPAIRRAVSSRLPDLEATPADARK
jgi:hypothetical protein